MTSKVFILGALLCTATLGSLHAQAKDLQFGLKGGVGFSEMSNSNLAKSPRIGIQVGGVLIQQISDTFSMQYEALYSQKGLVENQTLDHYKYKFEVNFDYLEIPILAKFKMGNQWSLYGGGYAGLVLSKKVKVTVNDSSSQTETDISDDFANNLDYGFLLGAQVNITEKWQIDARYNLGLADINKRTIDIKNSTFSIATTYLL